MFGDTVHQSTRFVYECILGKASWQARVREPEYVLIEYTFSDKNFRLLKLKGSQMSTLTVNKVFDRVIFVTRLPM